MNAGAARVTQGLTDGRRVSRPGLSAARDEFRIGLTALGHPITLASVALLILNDHVLKRSVPSALTGKLSDFAGLFFFPYLVIALASLARLALFRFKRGEILFGKLRPYFHKVGVAPVDGVCSTDIVVVTPREDGWFGFVLGHVSSTAFVEYTNAGSTGTKMPRTSWGEMARYPVVIPSANIGEAFSAQIRSAIDRIIASIHESRTLAALRDTLLPKLISGEIRVKDAGKIAEVAS